MRRSWPRTPTSRSSRSRRAWVDDPEAVRGVEAAFLRLRTALRRPAAAREVDEAAAAVGDALQVAASAASVANPRPISHLGVEWIAGAVLATMALLVLVVIRIMHVGSHV